MGRAAGVRWGLLGLLLFVPVAVWAFADYPLNELQEPWYMHRLVQHVFSALVGGLAGAFFSQKLRAFRLWFVLACTVISAIIAVIANKYLGNAVFFFIAASVAWALLREEEIKTHVKRPKPTTFGSAEWATLQHLMDNELIGENGFTLGFFKEYGVMYPLQYAGDRHLLTVAPTRSGKGVSSIIPNLLTYQGSAIVIDPKGENALITAPKKRQGRSRKKHPRPGPNHSCG